MSEPRTELLQSVTVYIVRQAGADKQVLLVHNNKLGEWLPPGGLIRFGEDPNQAAIREAYEEVGLRVTLHTVLPEGIVVPNGKCLISPRFTDRFYSPKHGKELVDFGFIAMCAPTAPVVLEESRLKEYAWCSGEELVQQSFPLKPNILRYAQIALSTFL